MMKVPHARTALVYGATGISGLNLIEYLAKNTTTDEWDRIIGICRRKEVNLDPISTKPTADPRIRLVGGIDLLNDSEEEIIRQLRLAKVQETTHVFYFSYKEEPTEDKLIETNATMLRKALRCTDAVAPHLQRWLLQCGVKYYGWHLGPIDNPVREHTRFPAKILYYPQEELIEEYTKDKSWDWVETRPDAIVGISKGNFMSLAASVAIYLVILKELGKPALFPGNAFLYNCVEDTTYAKLLAEFEVFLAIHPGAGREAFNIVNGDVFRWRQVWPKLAEMFELEMPPVQFKDMPEITSNRIRISQVCLKEFMKDKEPVWDAAAVKHGLNPDAFHCATWEFAGNRTWDLLSNMTKARKLGWSGYVDSEEMWLQLMRRFEMEHAVPRLRTLSGEYPEYLRII
ncbi:hypothetical protein BZG36_02930 [Bifiguratus adelaidae]|uniref:PRISE-like Rossmann-fold domain-containing protein n=1 Tax=Bifiguratus adelaidae TaxID=1938954 RepID=A0A261Y097_9FUNG|nr:hypothetical protein BZG36_02930 [Bifiguratus adelaidae]